MRTRSLFMGVLGAALMAMVSAAHAEEIKIGVLAKDGAAKATAMWGPTADYLNTAVPGHRFALVPLGFDQVFAAVERGDVHFFLVNSSMFVTAQERFGARPIATMVNSRQGKPSKAFGGVIFTTAERADINSLADLKGKRFMGVEKSSFGGWEMGLKVLLDAGLHPKKDLAALEFGGTHENVVLAVQNGVVDAGTVRTDTLERMAAAGDIDMQDFKLINRQDLPDFPFVSSTPLYPEWPFASTGAASPEVAAAVGEALIALDSTHPAAIAGKVVGWTAPEDYGVVQALQKSLEAAEQ